MSHNRIGFRHVDDGREQLRDSQSCTTDVLGETKRPEAGRLQCADLVKRVLVVEVSIFGAFGDSCQQFVEFGCVWAYRVHALSGGHGFVLPILDRRWHCFGSART
jgi:hypothetical protein